MSMIKKSSGESKIEIIDENKQVCSCQEFKDGIEEIHKSCKHAALNGVGISLPTLIYCPWCGKKLSKENK